MIYLGPLYRKEDEKDIISCVKCGLSNAPNRFQYALLEGFAENEVEKLSLVNVLPVGVWPKNCTKLKLPAKNWLFHNHPCYELGCINLPFIKQKQRERACAKLLKQLCCEDREVLIYSCYLPFLRAARKLPGDVKITLIAGRAHLKHTEGGDFRQATYRAVRQGLMKAKSVILEPPFNFHIEVPTEYLGRVMTDVTNMHGTSSAPEIFENQAVLDGVCPVATMRSYASELRAFTRGEGKITMNVGAYAPAHNQDEIIAKYAYDPLLDERNPSSSVFCKAGAGYAVPWDEADAMMHIKTDVADEDEGDESLDIPVRARAIKYTGTVEEDKELMRIFEATYGKIKPRRVAERKENKAPESKPRKKGSPHKNLEEHLILDGYNLIFAWEELEGAGETDFSLARDMLTRIMCSYTAFRKCHATIVFDAYKRRGGEGSEEVCGNVCVQLMFGDI